MRVNWSLFLCELGINCYQGFHLGHSTTTMYRPIEAASIRTLRPGSSDYCVPGVDGVDVFASMTDYVPHDTSLRFSDVHNDAVHRQGICSSRAFHAGLALLDNNRLVLAHETVSSGGSLFNDAQAPSDTCGTASPTVMQAKLETSVCSVRINLLSVGNDVITGIGVLGDESRECNINVDTVISVEASSQASAVTTPTWYRGYTKKSTTKRSWTRDQAESIREYFRSVCIQDGAHNIPPTGF
jgi:hypothetical protein